jgi:predicted nicotinamide N-methyase
MCSGLTVWDASIVLAKFLEHEKDSRGGVGMLHDKVVLELGSGAGLVGLAALHLGAKKVYCTEYAT